MYIKDGREILAGTIRLDKNFVRYFEVERDRGKHLFRMFNGFGISEPIIKRILAQYINHIVIRVYDKTKPLYVLVSLTRDWLSKGEEYNYNDVDMQRVLDIQHQKKVEI